MDENLNTEMVRSLYRTTPNHEFFVVLVLGKSTCALTFSGNIVEVLLPLQ